MPDGAGCGPAPLAVGSHLGSQWGYLGPPPNRPNAAADGGRQATAGGVGGRPEIVVAESRPTVLAVAGFRLTRSWPARYLQLRRTAPDHARSTGCLAPAPAVESADAGLG